jgi:hypothetical protein
MSLPNVAAAGCLTRSFTQPLLNKDFKPSLLVHIGLACGNVATEFTGSVYDEREHNHLRRCGEAKSRHSLEW